MANTLIEKAKKAGGIVIPTGVVVAAVVAIFVKQIAGWPMTVDKQINNHEIRITKTEDGLEDAEEDIDKIDVKMDRMELEQKAMRKDMNDGFNELKDLIREGR